MDEQIKWNFDAADAMMMTKKGEGGGGGGGGGGGDDVRCLDAAQT